MGCREQRDESVFIAVRILRKKAKAQRGVVPLQSASGTRIVPVLWLGSAGRWV